jgi:thiol:disulfide interchange protein
MRRFSLAVLCLVAAGCQPKSSPKVSESTSSSPPIASPSLGTSSGTTLESDVVAAKSVGDSVDGPALDLFAADRTAVKAAKPLEFRHDVDAAIAEAADKKLPCFVKFETTWCGPCKMMSQLVFTAKDVVDAADGVMCVMVDGDERSDLTERYAVKAYPTGVMIAADGSEAARFIGYQNVNEMAAFLKDKRLKP